ncbi:MAG: SDR family NAD(P)-dependent oxidoreductase [Pseudomonadota bacterium]|nr:SDR family NAD(P)-dependent oxidoreductase [Pseudomonadota bacterium]
MTIRLDDRVAIVTGAGAGLGRSHALALAARGARIVVNDLSQAMTGEHMSPSERVVEEIRAAGGVAISDNSSVADAEQARAMVERTVSEFGRVDILVNNAGIVRDRSFAKMTAGEFDSVVAVHLAGAAYCTMAAWGHMREANYGRVVLTTSNSGLYGNFGQANYASGKAGLIGLMNTLKLEGGKYNIAVNTLAPMAATPMTENVMDEATKAAFDPALVSAALVYLCSEACPDNGRIISTAGGHVSAVQVMSSQGVVLGRNASPETIAQNWGRICDFDGAVPFASAQEEMKHILSRLSAA